MNQTKINTKLREYLESKNACKEALRWLADRTPEEMVIDCPRGDWLMWITYWLQIDKRKIILTSGHIANTVRDLMEDKRSRDIVDMAIKYGEGKATKEELDAASHAASHAAADADASYASAYVSDAAEAACAADASYASDASSYAAAYAAAYAAYAACNADADSSAAKTANQSETADIAREFLGAEIIEKLKEKLG